MTDDEALAGELKQLRNGGQSSRYVHETAGFNSRLDELQAAILRAKLPYLERENARRRDLAARYEAGLEGSDARPVTSRNRDHSARHLFVIRVRERDALMEHLRARDVDCLVHYPVPAHLQPAYRSLGQLEGSCPAAEDAARHIVSLPIHPGMMVEEVDAVIEAVRSFS